MTDMTELSEELYNVILQKRELESKERVIKDTLLIYLQKTNTKKISSDHYIVEIQNRPTYQVPDVKSLRKIMGNEFAERYLVVSDKVRYDLPPALIDKLCPIKSNAVYVMLKMRKISEIGEPIEQTVMT